MPSKTGNYVFTLVKWRLIFEDLALHICIESGSNILPTNIRNHLPNCTVLQSRNAPSNYYYYYYYCCCCCLIGWLIYWMIETYKCFSHLISPHACPSGITYIKISSWVSNLFLSPSNSILAASPKSPILTSKLSLRNKFPSFKSRWIILLWCRYTTPSSIWRT